MARGRHFQAAGPPPLSLALCRLTSPKRKDDVKMVGALVYKMLQSLEKETGWGAARSAQMSAVAMHASDTAGADMCLARADARPAPCNSRMRLRG